jgi:hypothetical protein
MAIALCTLGVVSEPKFRITPGIAKGFTVVFPFQNDLAHEN